VNFKKVSYIGIDKVGKEVFDLRIPESFIQEVIRRNPLEEIVSQYTTLKRAGSNMVCCCPFHNEKTPSFTLYAEPSHYFCYGCGAGGDVITFIRQIENLDYVAAVEFLARRAGLSMPVSSPMEKRVDKKRFYDLNAEAARYWHKCLFSPEGKEGLEYLQNRGLSLPIIKRFGLGFAPNSWQGLTDHLTRMGYKLQEMKDAFLVGISQKGRPYDIFRGRAMFPIIDVSGNVVAFSGRQTAPMNEGDRKYVNTNETAVFRKGNILFGLNIAKNDPSKEIVLCEGNMDAVSLHAHGISNAVASLGTALTGAQCRLLSRYAEKVLLCYDSDRAGREATKKAIRLLQETGIRVRVMTLEGKSPDGKDIKDPDDYIRTFGKGAFDKVAREAPGAIEYLFGEILSRHELDTMDGKNAFIKECVSFLSGARNPIEAELYIGRISQLTGVPAEVVKVQTGKESGKVIKKQETERLERELRRTQGLGDRVNPDKAKFLSSAAKEENVLGILLLRPEYLLDKTIRPLLDPNLFQCEFCRKALQSLLDITQEENPLAFGALNEFFSPEEIGELERMRKKREELAGNSPSVLKELLERLADAGKKKEIKNEPLSAAWLEKLKAEKA
jgi:DNA primase